MKLQSRLCLIILPCGTATILFICWVAYAMMLEHEKQSIAETMALHLSWAADRIALSENALPSTLEAAADSPILSAFRQSGSIHLHAVQTDLYVSDDTGAMLSLTDGARLHLASLIAADTPEDIRALPTIELPGWQGDTPVHDAGSVVALHPLSQNLFLISRVSSDTIFSGASHMFNLIALVTTIGTFGGIFSFLTLQRQLILNPLIDVSENAKHIGLSSYEQAPCLESVLKRSDEIGELSRAVETTHRRLNQTIGELKASQSANERLAHLDNLTDLPNRRLFQKQSAQHLSEAKEAGRHLAVIFMDLDNFKNINDIHGHDAGDELLLEVSRRLKETLHYNETSNEHARLAARLGGDEFIFMVDTGSGEDSEARAIAAAEELLETVVQPMNLSNTEHLISASLGIALFPEHGKSVEALNTHADAAMYEAKRRNKNGYAIYHESMLESLAERLQLENDLRAALGSEQLHLHYQPKYDIESGDMVGAEALLRWTHPEKGNIPPAHFIGLAESSGLIHELGAWVIDEACRQWRAWRDAGSPLAQVAVNVSSRQFEHGDLRETILASLKRHDCPPSALEIELTESCVMASFDDIRETLNQLRDDGISIAIDDFGTGYSSLSLISNMPIQTLKIDRSFVSGMKASNSNGKIVTTLLHLAEQLSLKVVAEGIEEADELALLKSLSCDFGQGYYLSRPMDVPAMDEALAQLNGPKARAA